MTRIEVPEGNLAVVVTYFEMTQKPAPSGHQPDVHLSAWPRPDLAEYKSYFREIGDKWLWFGRLSLSDEELQSTIHNPQLEIFKAQSGGKDIGLVELDFSQPEQCEICYFGLIPEVNGKGLGGTMMSEALNLAWRDGIKRVWLHTCTHDSPRALAFYRRSGFIAYKREVEIDADPRLTGLLPIEAGPHIPVIKPLSNQADL
ncbi:GNAT family N-acetyltransferase [Parasphingorhabdus sp.]|uniref:GNAT family N-acetyltransferase n=1 Tax=Parasphingorhabdus sp. TaxID=2709688 RepID=UPI002F95E5B1